MEPRTITARGSPPFVVAAKKSESPEAGRVIAIPAPNDRGTNPARERERSSRSEIVHLNSHLFDIYGKAWCFTPAFGYWLDTAGRTFACCVASQMNWLALMAPYASSTSASGTSFGQTEVTAEVLERSMDIAIGERFAELESKVASSTESETQRTEEVLEHSRDIAIGAKAMVAKAA